MPLVCGQHGIFNAENFTCDCEHNWENLNEFSFVDDGELTKQPCVRNIAVIRFLYAVLLCFSVIVLIVNSVLITRTSQLRRIGRILFGYVMLIFACTQKLIHPSEQFGKSPLFYITFSLGSVLTTTSGSYLAGKYVAYKRKRLRGGPIDNMNDFLDEKENFLNSKFKSKRIKAFYLDVISSDSMKYFFYSIGVVNFVTWVYYGIRFRDYEDLLVLYYIGIMTQLIITLYTIAVPMVLMYSFFQDGLLTIKYAVDLQPIQIERLQAGMNRFFHVIIICGIMLSLDLLMFIFFISSPESKGLWSYFWPVQIIYLSIMLLIITFTYRANRFGAYSGSRVNAKSQVSPRKASVESRHR